MLPQPLPDPRRSKVVRLLYWLDLPALIPGVI